MIDGDGGGIIIVEDDEALIAIFGFGSIADVDDEEDEDEEELRKAVFLDALTFKTRTDPAENFDAFKWTRVMTR